jgi:Spy/CpxP family protein refolding chaperone
MKRLITFLGIVVLFGAIASPLSAQGWRGMEFGPFMGHGPGPAIDPRMDGFPLGPWFGPLTEEQRTQLDELNKRFQEETAELRETLADKSRELNTILTSEKPDEKQAKALQKEISDLNAKLAEKRLDFRFEMAKIIPESGLGRGFGRGLGTVPRMFGFPERPGPGFKPLTEEQRDQLKELNKKFREETAELREDLSGKFRELRRVLDSEKPDEDKAKSLQKEISDLRAELSQKTLSFRLEVGKILPETGYARGYGRGFGPHRDYGPRMGYGPRTGYGPHMGYGLHMDRGRGMGRAPGFW